MKQYIEEQLNALLNVGSASDADTVGFNAVAHDDYVEKLQQYLASYGENWAEWPLLENVQGLNDRGIDLVAEFRIANYSAGFQVKSYGDITSDRFSQTIWQQIGQSGSYEVDRLYVILCGNMTNRSHYQKVRHFVASIEQGNYPEISVIQSQQAWNLCLSFEEPIDPGRIRQRMSRHIVRFLHAIGRSEEINNPNSLYRNLEDLYVPPTEFGAIEQILDDNGIVFISGAPHLGKTFTAVRLLYNLFLEGYTPIWLLGRITSEHVENVPLQEVYRRHDIRDTFSLEFFIRPGQALYLEDPFGRTDLEELEFATSVLKIQELLQLLVRRSGISTMPPKVIVTSPESIFHRAVEVQPNLAKNAVSLRAGMDDSDDSVVSYGFEKRVAILERYLHFYSPHWADPLEAASGDERERIGEVMSLATSFLWTPHGIQRFMFSTRNTDLDELDLLKQQVGQAENISASFADEVGVLTLLQQLVFVSIFLINYQKTAEEYFRGRIDYREQYLALVVALDHAVDEGERIWRTVLGEHPTVVEQISNPKTEEPDVRVRFAHPAYGAGVSRFLSSHPEILDSIFSRVQALLRTPAGTRLAQALVPILPHWYHRVPSTEARVLTAFLATDDSQLLLRLATEYALRYVFTSNDALKEAIRAIVQHPLAQGDSNLVRYHFVHLAHQAIDLPMDDRCAILLLGINENPRMMSSGTYRTYDLVCRHYDEVTEEAREHLHQYLADNPNNEVVARSLGQYYDLLPVQLQEVAADIAEDTQFTSFLAQKELIDGLILGFGSHNLQAHHLFQVIANSPDVKTQAYLASALVPIYNQLDEELVSIWQVLVSDDNPHSVVATADRIIALSAEQPEFNEMLQANGLLDLLLDWTTSRPPVIRAELLRLLLEYQTKLTSVDVQRIIGELLHDDSELVRAAALYWMLSNPELQTEFPDRFQELMDDTSTYSHLSRIIFYTNIRNDVQVDIENQVRELQNSDSRLLHNALLFHISAQEPFLSDFWSRWLEAQAKTDRGDRWIISLARQHHASDDETRPQFEPDWLIDYEDPAQLIWFHPPKSYVRLPSSGFRVLVKKVDQLNLLLSLISNDPDYLEC